MSDERKDLPGVNAPNFDERVRESLQTYLGTRGNPLDRGLTLRDLKDAGLIDLRPGVLTGGGGANGGTKSPVAGPGPAVVYVVDLSPPPPPDGLAAKTSGKSIQVTITPQKYTQGHGPGKVTIFGAKYLSGDPLPTYSGAAVLAEFTGDVFAFPVDIGSLYRIWAKSVSVDGVESSIAGGINGVEPTPGLLDDVSIASLTVSTIRSGSITVGQFIQSSNFLSGSNGWRINGNGVAEFAGAIVRGTVYATAGQIGGNTIDATGVQSPGYTPGSAGWRLNSDGTITANQIILRGSAMGGAFTGYAWPVAPGTGFYLGSEGLRLGNFNTGNYVDITSAGNFYAPGFDVVNGLLTIRQANVVKTLNIAGEAVTIPRYIFAPSAGDVSLTITLPETSSIFILASVNVPNTGFHQYLYVDGVTVRTETMVGGTIPGLLYSTTLSAGDHIIRVRNDDPTGVKAGIYALVTRK